MSSVFIFPALISEAIFLSDKRLPKLIEIEEIVQEDQENQDSQEPQPNPNSPSVIISDSAQQESDSNPFKIIEGTPRRGVKSVKDSLNGSFSIFYSLLVRTRDNLLLSQNNLVIFAPTDQVWASLAESMELSTEELIKQLIQDENREQLTQLLRNHIVVDGISDAQFEQGSVETLGGETLQIKRTNDGIEVNGIKVSSPDFIQSIEQNSVIIPLDQFLFEPDLR
ncbi:MAG: fasciclin domain-containing protein [Microcoleaceae cyanobacterium]